MKKMTYTAILLTGILVSFVSCEQNRVQEKYGVEAIDSATFRYHTSEGEGELQLVAVTDSTYEVQHVKSGDVVSTWPLDYAVYRFDCGDVTGDGMPEVLVGTVKKTHYRPVMDRRLFIFHLHNGRDIRPLWLGSRVSRPLIDFRVECDTVPNLIHTWEREGENDTVQILYRYKGFGLKFYKYL